MANSAITSAYSLNHTQCPMPRQFSTIPQASKPRPSVIQDSTNSATPVCRCMEDSKAPGVPPRHRDYVMSSSSSYSLVGFRNGPPDVTHLSFLPQKHQTSHKQYANLTLKFADDTALAFATTPVTTCTPMCGADSHELSEPGDDAGPGDAGGAPVAQDEACACFQPLRAVHKFKRHHCDAAAAAEFAGCRFWRRVWFRGRRALQQCCCSGDGWRHAAACYSAAFACSHGIEP